MTQLDRFPLGTLGPVSPPNLPGYVYGWRITSYFGGRTDPITGRPGSHGGEDIGAPGGTPMVAVADGFLTQGWDSSGGGNWSGLTIGNGDYFGYGHASGFAGGGAARNVRAGEVIAWVDSTGASTGNHLHFAYRPAGRSSYADPYDLLMEVAIRTAGGSPLPPVLEDDMFSDTDRSTLNSINGAVHYGSQTVVDVLAQWENDTRTIILNGVKMITASSDAELSDRIAQAGWASRPYAFCYDGHPAVFMWIETSAGLCRQWIATQADLADLVQTLLNPAIQVFPADVEARHDAAYPLVGAKPT